MNDADDARRRRPHSSGHDDFTAGGARRGADRGRGDRTRQGSGGWDDTGVADDTSPADLSAVNATDELIDALIADRPVRASTADDRALVDLLGEWREEILAEPDTGHPTLEDVEFETARRQRVAAHRRSMRVIKFVGAAAALIIVAFGGLTALSHSASPGDPLWSVKQVMFSKQADSTLASSEVGNDLDRAEQALHAGQTGAALSYVDRAEKRLGKVSDRGTRDAMSSRISKLLATITTAPAGSNPKSPATGGDGVSTTSEAPSTTTGASTGESSAPSTESSAPSTSTPPTTTTTEPTPTPTSEVPPPTTPDTTVLVVPPVIPASSSSSTSYVPSGYN
ncbi:anti-sigma-D factor RsdA [Gordonia jinhuaensis]|uniref:anti-sigma-D factor RsdA n=1 Tax=Gordonia jinhuaensis TaxID=1517702 RepID=UPI00166360C4|nr:anti-sigma-D factor RsdA [Gordonia jinhuaensis]